MLNPDDKKKTSGLGDLQSLPFPLAPFRGLPGTLNLDEAKSPTVARMLRKTMRPASLDEAGGTPDGW